MKIKLLTVAILLLAINACGSDHNEKFIGYWELKNEGVHFHPAVIQITQDGSTYLYKDAINLKKLNYQIALKQENDKLILDSQYIPNETLSLTNDGAVLMIGARRFIRIAESEIGAVRQRLDEEKRRKDQQLQDMIDAVN